VDSLRKVVAVLIALRSLTNFPKPFVAGSRFVIAGHLMGGVASTVVAPLFGLAMLAYAAGLWGARPWARPVSVAYALWATVNVVLFPFFEGVPARFAPWMYLVFAVPGLVVPWLAVWSAHAGRRE
jgi:hypothetical protein